MASKVPIIGQVPWIGIIPLLSAFILSIQVAIYLGATPMVGAAAIFLLYYLLRCTISSSHRKGVKLVKQMRFEEAIPHFQASYDFFTRNSWLDRFRCVFLLSPSRISYKEMALVNIGFSYSQQQDGINAEEWYKRALSEYPESSIAIAALNMLKSGKSI